MLTRIARTHYALTYAPLQARGRKPTRLEAAQDGAKRAARWGAGPGLTLAPLCGTGLLAKGSAPSREGLLPKALDRTLAAVSTVACIAAAVPCGAIGAMAGAACGAPMGRGRAWSLRAAVAGGVLGAAAPLFATLLLSAAQYACVIGLRLLGLVPVALLASTGAVAGLVGLCPDSETSAAAPSKQSSEPPLDQDLLEALHAWSDAAVRYAETDASGTQTLASLLRKKTPAQARAVRQRAAEVVSLEDLRAGRDIAALDALLSTPTGEPALEVVRATGRGGLRGPRHYEFARKWRSQLNERLTSLAPQPRSPMTVAEHGAIVDDYLAMTPAQQKAAQARVVAIVTASEQIEGAIHESKHALLVERLGPEFVRLACKSDAQPSDAKSSQAKSSPQAKSPQDAARQELLGKRKPTMDVRRAVNGMAHSIERVWLKYNVIPDPDPSPPTTLLALALRCQDALTRIAATGSAAPLLVDIRPLDAPMRSLLSDAKRKRAAAPRALGEVPGS